MKKFTFSDCRIGYIKDKIKEGLNKSLIKPFNVSDVNIKIIDLSKETNDFSNTELLIVFIEYENKKFSITNLKKELISLFDSAGDGAELILFTEMNNELIIIYTSNK